MLEILDDVSINSMALPVKLENMKLLLGSQDNPEPSYRDVPTENENKMMTPVKYSIKIER